MPSLLPKSHFLYLDGCLSLPSGRRTREKRFSTFSGCSPVPPGGAGGRHAPLLLPRSLAPASWLSRRTSILFYQRPLPARRFGMAAAGDLLTSTLNHSAPLALALWWLRRAAHLYYQYCRPSPSSGGVQGDVSLLLPQPYTVSRRRGMRQQARHSSRGF